MTHEQPEPDCMGGSNFYGLKPLSETFSIASEISNHEENNRRFNAETGEAYCLKAIIAELRNKDYYIRMRAVRELGQTNDIEAVPALISALADSCREVRDNAYAALHGLDSHSQTLPLPCRVLMSETVNASQRAVIMLALGKARFNLTSVFGYPSIQNYCKEVLEQDDSHMKPDEKLVLQKLKSGASEVLRELENRNDSTVLLRAGESSEHNQQLLRSSDGLHNDDDTKHLLQPIE